MNDIIPIKQKDNAVNEYSPNVHIDNVYLSICADRENTLINNSFENSVAR